MSFLDVPYPGPGPQERKWTSRFRFRLFGRWPESVVTERLFLSDLHTARMRGAALQERMAGPTAPLSPLPESAYGPDAKPIGCLDCGEPLRGAVLRECQNPR